LKIEKKISQLTSKKCVPKIIFFKIENSKNGMHNFRLKNNLAQNFSPLSLKTTEKWALKIFVNGGGGGGGYAAWQTEKKFRPKHIF
jgi:hypothetical protein